MPVDDSPHSRESDSASLELICRMQSLERPEELLRVVHVEPDSIVANEINVLAWSVVVSGFYRRARLISSELDRVGEQILKHLSDESPVAGSRRQMCELECDAAFFGSGNFLFLESAPGEFRHIDFRKD